MYFKCNSHRLSHKKTEVVSNLDVKSIFIQHTKYLEPVSFGGKILTRSLNG